MKRLMIANRLVLDDVGPSDQVFDWMGDQLAEDPTGCVAWGSTIPPRGRHLVGTVLSFFNILICRCLDAATSCKIKKASYSVIKQLLSSTQLLQLH
jgi:hypothetical protein